MRITMDTNVLVSSTFWNGDSDRIMKKVERNEIELVLSEDILLEFERVLEYREIQEKIQNKNLEMKRSLDMVESIATIVVPIHKFQVIKDDPEDNKILECAVAGKVDYIISKDKHVLKLKEFRGIRILTPDDFLKKQ